MPSQRPVLIANAEFDGRVVEDVLIIDGAVTARGLNLTVPEHALKMDARGGALLPGLNDHHIHLASLAASRYSVECGPPNVNNGDALARALCSAASSDGQWLRGIGYHESVAGDIDARWLDACVDHVPVRIQHRGGRLWVFNSRALALLDPQPDDRFERVGGRLTGRLFEGDRWLRKRMIEVGAGFPALGAVSQELADYGITGLTDTTPSNGLEELNAFSASQADGELLQEIRVMGGAQLNNAGKRQDGQLIAERKFHLLESQLPDFEWVVREVQAAHEAGRNAAFHCVTRTELVFTLAALREAGVIPGDRIEHASVTPLEQLQEIADLGLTVVAQPAFIRERGDQYLRDVAADDQPYLYRLRSFLDAGVRMAGSSDAPYTSPNPWLSMQAATDRSTLKGHTVGISETLTAEQALALYTSPVERPGDAAEPLVVGTKANLCLLKQNWSAARKQLSSVKVAATFRDGVCVSTRACKH